MIVLQVTAIYSRGHYLATPKLHVADSVQEVVGKLKFEEDDWEIEDGSDGSIAVYDQDEVSHYFMPWKGKMPVLPQAKKTFVVSTDVYDRGMGGGGSLLEVKKARSLVTLLTTLTGVRKKKTVSDEEFIKTLDEHNGDGDNFYQILDLSTNKVVFGGPFED